MPKVQTATRRRKEVEAREGAFEAVTVAMGCLQIPQIPPYLLLSPQHHNLGASSARTGQDARLVDLAAVNEAFPPCSSTFLGGSTSSPSGPAVVAACYRNGRHALVGSDRSPERQPVRVPDLDVEERWPGLLSCPPLPPSSNLSDSLVAPPRRRAKDASQSCLKGFARNSISLAAE